MKDFQFTIFLPVITIIILLLFFFSYLIPRSNAEFSENRTLATFDMVVHPEVDSVVYHESPIERLDAALSDQFPFRGFVVRRYLSLFNALENCTFGVVRIFSKWPENQYSLHSIGNYELIENTNYITQFPQIEPMDVDIIRKRSEQLDLLHSNYPSLIFISYYVTQAYDTSWFNCFLGTSAADHYQDILDGAPEYVRNGRLEYKDLADYMDIHYKSDHHWNNRGARRGYEDVYSIMSRDMDLGDIKKPLIENTVSKTYDFVYLGSYGRNLGELYQGYDDFSFYEYNLPDRKVSIINPDTLEETNVVKIGLYDEYKRGEINKGIDVDHYITMYGTAKDIYGNDYDDASFPFVIRSSEGNGKNLIITGDSYGRALRDEIASHFDTTVYLDYRILSKVPIDYIIDKYDVNVMLICSNGSMWGSEDFLFTFKENI